MKYCPSGKTPTYKCLWQFKLQFYHDLCYVNHFHFTVLYYSQQIRRCNDLDCCAGEPINSDIYWLPYPTPDEENLGHLKKFNQVYGTHIIEDSIPSKLNDIRKVTQEQQVRMCIYHL